jgi:cytochrome P450
MERLVVPNFETEAEEAEWWDQHMDAVEADFAEALESGRAHRLSDTEHGRRVIRAARRALAARSAAKAFIAGSSEQDRERFHALAAKAGLDDETYISQILLNALAGAETLAA